MVYAQPFTQIQGFDVGKGIASLVGALGHGHDRDTVVGKIPADGTEDLLRFFDRMRINDMDVRVTGAEIGKAMFFQIVGHKPHPPACII